MLTPPPPLPPSPFRPNTDSIPNYRTQLNGFNAATTLFMRTTARRLNVLITDPQLLEAYRAFFSTECPRFILADTYRSLPNWTVLIARAYQHARSNELTAPALTPDEVNSAFKAFHIITQQQIDMGNVPAQHVYFDANGNAWPTMGQILV